MKLASPTQAGIVYNKYTMDSLTFDASRRRAREEELTGLEAASRLDETVTRAADTAFFDSLSRVMLAAREQDVATANAAILACIEPVLDSVVIARQPDLRAYILERATARFDEAQVAMLRTLLG